jgi:glucose/arabinose dehydrogenase
MAFALALLVSLAPVGPAGAQDNGPTVVDPNLSVRTALSGLTTPIGVAFLNENEMFVIEKDTGQVLHVVDEQVSGVVLDLAVNFASERGLLGITLDPAFDENGYVYLYWTCLAPAPAGNAFFPSEFECADEPVPGPDTDDILAVPLLGNRVDRFVWDGSALTWDMNLVKLRAFQNDGAPFPQGQNDADQPPRGNHNGGVITFGSDGMLYVVIGDVGRRGMLQNLPFGPIPYPSEEEEAGLAAALAQEGEGEGEGDGEGGVPIQRGDIRALSHTGRNASLLTVADDQFGGPYPDDAHFTGVVLRLSPDGTIPTDNPFYNVGAAMGGETGENIQMTFAYGIRNSFGMDVDPETGRLWVQENGEDAYDELNLVNPGFNSGWIQVAGPLEDVANYKAIETTSLHNEDFPNLQQFRWGPENIADTPQEARRRLFRLPGSRYRDPAFSWEFAIAPAAIGFHEGDALGEEYNGDLFMGLSLPIPEGGPLLRFELTRNRQRIDSDTRVAHNGDFNSLVGSEQFLFGTGFGVVTDIETGPNGSLYVVSIDHGAVYEIFAGDGEEPPPEPEIVELFAALSGANEVPGPGDEDGTGSSTVTINLTSGELCFTITAENIILPAAAAHIHVGEAGVPGPVVVPLTPPDETGMSEGCVADVDAELLNAIAANPAGYYVNVHTSDFPDGAIRGQLSE